MYVMITIMAKGVTIAFSWIQQPCQDYIRGGRFMIFPNENSFQFVHLNTKKIHDWLQVTDFRSENLIVFHLLVIQLHKIETL